MKKKKSKYLIPVIILVLVLFIILLIIIGRQLDKDSNLDVSSEKGINHGLEVDIQELAWEFDETLTPVAIPKDLSLPNSENEWLDIKNELTDPIVLVAFLNKYFDFNFDNNLIARDPIISYNSKTANSVDLAVLAAEILKSEFIIMGVIRYDYLNEEGEDLSHFVTVFRDGDIPKYLTLNQNNQVELYVYKNSFLNVIDNEEARLRSKVYRWAYFPSGQLDLSEVLDPFTWQYLR